MFDLDDLGKLGAKLLRKPEYQLLWVHSVNFLLHQRVTKQFYTTKSLGNIRYPYFLRVKNFFRLHTLCYITTFVYCLLKFINVQHEDWYVLKTSFN